MPGILSISTITIGFAYDAGLYHLNSQHWIRESNIPIGLSNLHFRYGFSSIIDYISSSFWLNGNFEILDNSEITTLTIQTTPEWKQALAKEAIKLEKEDFNFKTDGINYLKSLPIFENEELRAEVFQTWNNLTTGSKKKRGKVFTWSQNDKELINSKLKESTFLLSNKEFLLQELDLQNIFIYTVGDGEDVAGKAKVAFPLEPGISFT